MAIEGVVWSERRSTFLAGTFFGIHVGYGFSRLFSHCAVFVRDKLFVSVFCRGVDRDRDIPVGRFFFAVSCKTFSC